jgi:hypothetical protein
MATQTSRVSGTFTGTGQSDDIVIGRNGRVRLEFAGAATVVVEDYSEAAADFVPLAGGTFTSSVSMNVDGGNRRVRLNCTAHTNNVVYELLP